MCSSSVALSSKYLPRLDAFGCTIRSSVEGDAYALKCFRLGEPVCLFRTELMTRDVDRDDVVKIRWLSNPMNQEFLRTFPKQQVFKLGAFRAGSAYLLKVKHLGDMNLNVLRNALAAPLKMESKQTSAERGQRRLARIT